VKESCLKTKKKKEENQDSNLKAFEKLKLEIKVLDVK
jgi:hypothetical protein